MAGPLAKKVQGRWVGHWRNLFVSPDGRTLLATWSAECEIPIAVFVPAAGGSPRAVSGDEDWKKAPESIGLGWSGSWARVEFLRAACGSGIERPGIYLVHPLSGRKKFVRALTR